MAPPRNRFADILLNARVVDELQMRSALARMDQWGGRITAVVVDMGLATEDAVTSALALALRVPRAHLDKQPADAGALARLDPDFCERRGVFPVQLRDNAKTLVLAMADPTDLMTSDAVASRARVRVVPQLAHDREVMRAVRRHYLGQDVDAAPARFQGAVASEAMDEPSDVMVLTDGQEHRHDRAVAAAPPPARPRPPAPPAAVAAPAGPPPLTAEEQGRLALLRENQDKSARILRAVLELLLEKGALGPGELGARLRAPREP